MGSHSQPPPGWQPPPPQWQPGQPQYPQQYPPGYGAPYQPPPSPKKSHTTRNVILAIVGAVIVIVIIAAAASGGGKKKNTADTVTTSAAAPPSSAVSSAPVVSTAASTPPAKTTAAPPAAAKVVLQLAGNGVKNSVNFTVTQSQWTIAYTYDCTAFLGGTGNFIITINDSTGKSDYAKPGVNELGAKGNDNTVEHGAGTYSLTMNSECTWTVTVTG